MDLPAPFRAKIARTFGDAGEQWLQRIPAIVDRCRDRWQLSSCTPFDNLSINLVCAAPSAVYGDAVLKIDGPHPERHTEILALQLYRGRHAVACHDVAEEDSALLLERLRPGHDLRSVTDPRAKVAIAADLIAGLPIPESAIGPPESHIFPTYAGWIERAFAKTRAQYAPSAQLRSHLDRGEAFFREISAQRFPPVLLHGDLHHENIIAGPGGSWKAIDPQGVIGPACFEPARFIQNHVADSNTGFCDADELDRAVRQCAARLGTTERNIAIGVFILDALSTCWSYEMNCPPQRIATGVEVGAQILRYVEGI